MSNPRSVVALMCAGVLAACGSGGSQSADIAKVSDLKASFGPDFKVTEVPRTGIDPRLLAGQKLPDGLTFDPSECAKFATGQLVPPGTKGNMSAVSAEGQGNRFVVIAVETNEPVPVTDPGAGCKKVIFSGGAVRGSVESVDAPKVDGAQTLGVHRILQTVINGQPRTGEVYNYSAHFGVYQVIVSANPLVVPDEPVAPVNTQRAGELLVAGVKAIRG
jgi:Domain of unknown function (DUF5642)